LLTEAGIDIERDAITVMPVPGSNEPGVSFGLQAARALEDGAIDGFWANALGAECAVRSGAGTVIVDVRRGDGPVRSQNFTFPALITSARLIEENPEVVTAATRAIVAVQRALKSDVSQATEVGNNLFPPYEAGLIAEVVSRDLPYYDPAIREDVVDEMQAFIATLGGTSATVPYQQVVATQFSELWNS
jgi:ABC-type nitrate/sulfonate/bicarbonate transport system substrate-binding protein